MELLQGEAHPSVFTGEGKRKQLMGRKWGNLGMKPRDMR